MGKNSGKKSSGKGTGNSGEGVQIHKILALFVAAVAVLSGCCFLLKRKPSEASVQSSSLESNNKAELMEEPSQGATEAEQAKARLEVAEILGYVTEQVTTLKNAGRLDRVTAAEYLANLDLLENEGMDGLGDDATAASLREAASVVRAQLLSAAMGLKDSEVEQQYGVSSYSSPRYWEGHYSRKANETFDWYVSWGTPLGDGKTLRDWTMKAVPISARLLVLGSGNSALSADMYREGYRQIENIDVSASVIKQMRGKHAVDMPEMTWTEMNAQELTFDDGSFDAVIDKGTLDAVSTDTEQLQAVVSQVQRVLRPAGVLISVASKSIDVLSEAARGLTCTVQNVTAPGSASNTFLHSCTGK